MYTSLNQILLPLVIEGKLKPEQIDLIKNKIGHLPTSLSMVKTWELIKEIVENSKNVTESN